MEDTSRELTALEMLIREGTDDDVRRFFLLLRPADLADVLESVPEGDRLRVVRLMSAPLASDVLVQVKESEREEIFEDLSAEERAEIVHEAKSDDAADLIGSLTDEEKAQTLDKLEKEEREEIEELLRYPEDSAGGIMQTEVVTVRGRSTVEQAIARVRGTDMRDVGEIHEVFVVDAENRLIGVVSPADLLHADPKSDLRSIVEPNPVAVPVDMDQEKIAEKVRDHDLAAVPVVDASGVLLGQVLHDDIADVLEEEATEDIAKMAGADPGELYEDTVIFAVRSRAPWLAPAFVGGLAVSFLLSSAEDVLKLLPILPAFLPVILGMAGNVGTQTSALTVRALALGRLDGASAWRVIGRQFATGLGLGTAFGLVLVAFVLWRHQDVELAWTYAMLLGLSLVTAMTVGTTMGVTVPLSLHKLGFDPAIATSPFVQTANDLTGAGILLLLTYAMGLV